MSKWPEIHEAGISGIRHEAKNEATVYYIESAEPGQGNLSKYVDERIASHPKTMTLRARLVTNPIIQGMLLRRGFIQDGFDFERPGIPEEASKPEEVAVFGVGTAEDVMAASQTDPSVR